jgi:hypothetical protein
VLEHTLAQSVQAQATRATTDWWVFGSDAAQQASGRASVTVPRTVHSLASQQASVTQCMYFKRATPFRPTGGCFTRHQNSPQLT